MEGVFISLTGLGFLLSWYLWNVGRYAGKKKNYLAFCDFNSRISCTKVLTSTSSKLFGAPNSIYGMIGYFLLLVLILLGELQYVFILATAAFLLSLYLAYLQYTQVKTFCVVCTLIYFINLFIALLSGFRLFY